MLISSASDFVCCSDEGGREEVRECVARRGRSFQFLFFLACSFWGIVARNFSFLVSFIDMDHDSCSSGSIKSWKRREREREKGRGC